MQCCIFVFIALEMTEVPVFLCQKCEIVPAKTQTHFILAVSSSSSANSLRHNSMASEVTVCVTRACRALAEALWEGVVLAGTRRVVTVNQQYRLSLS